jgi:hypothetical protein
MTFDKHLFTQIGLDSGLLTMLGTIVHSFTQPGEYRCAVHEGEEVKAVFTISSDKASPNAHVSVDLASLASWRPPPQGDDGSYCKERGPEPGCRRYVVNPRGYVLFHVSQGAGGYYVHARRTEAGQEDKGYDSRSLTEGDVFTAIVLRPGTYSLTNSLTGATGELVVTYPVRGQIRYPPPQPVRIACGPRTFEPDRPQIDPGQGVIFENRAHARIRIKLEKADDGPPKEQRPAARRARKAVL